jgi:replicative DNA helicase
MKRRLIEDGSASNAEAGEITVPHDPVTEQVIIAAACVDVETRNHLVDIVQPDAMLAEQHRIIWSGIRELKHRKLEFDLATLQRLVGDKLDVSYLSELIRARPRVPDNMRFHLDNLFWDRQRAIAVTGPIASLVEAIRNPREQPERVRALARAVAQSFEGHGSSFLIDPKELVREAVANINARLEGYAVYPFGIDGLDNYANSDRRRMIPGAFPGGMTVVTGVPGSGKSTFTSHVGLGIARQGRRVLYGAWEVQAPMTLEIMACLSLGWKRSDLYDVGGNESPTRQQFLTRERVIQIEERMHIIAQHITFMRNPFRRLVGQKITNAHNLDIVQEHIAESGCEVFIGDLWFRCLKDTDPAEEEQALFRQQAMLEEMNVHGILVQQQRSKDIEQRADKRPTREGIKGSGAWAEAADNIIGIHRPALWKKIPDDFIEALIFKQRFGKWPIAVEFHWDADRGSIKGGAEIDYEQPGEGSEFDKKMNDVKPSKKRRHN